MATFRATVPTFLARRGPTGVEGVRWKPFTNLPVSAEVAAQELQRIYRETGSLTPDLIVSASAEPDAVLHDCFEWDDDEAARAHRADQARYLLRHLVVVYRKSDQTLTHPVRYVINLRRSPADERLEDDEDQPRNTYLPIAQVMGDEQVRRRYVAQAFADLMRWRARYRDVEELARVFRAIEEVEEHLGRGSLAV